MLNPDVSSIPVVFIHGAHVRESFGPLLENRRLESYQLIEFTRRGFGEDGPAEHCVSVSVHAADVLDFLRSHRIRQTRLVGHSFGGVIAVAAAIQQPQMVHSLVLMEPAVRGQLDGEATAFKEALRPMQALYEAGRAREAVESHLRSIAGPEYRAILERSAPGSMERAIANAATFFRSDLPALLAWRCTAADVRHIDAPVLYLVGGANNITYERSRRLISAWLPQTRSFTIPGCHHYFQLERPELVAEVLVDFFCRYP
jgi:pimeloyl-ACP methyl ester carboxylesterase